MNKTFISLLSLLLLGGILILANMVVGRLGYSVTRYDFTENQLYSLSPGSQKIFERIKEKGLQANVRFYVARQVKGLPEEVNTYARTVEDFLRNLENVSGGVVQLEIFDPSPDTDEVTKAEKDGIEGIPLQSGDHYYLGLVVESLNQKEVLPFLNPGEEESLEYNVVRAIRKVTEDEVPVLGVISGLPVAGPPDDLPPMMMMQARTEPWIFIRRLRMDYEVRDLGQKVEEIPHDVKLLLVVHPSGITEQAEYAIDQFLLKGGKVLAFLDPSSLAASQAQQNPLMGMSISSSTFKKLLPGWGVTLDHTGIVADMELRTSLGDPEPWACLLTLRKDQMNTADRSVSTLGAVNLLETGALTFKEVKGQKSEVLLKSSRNHELIQVSSAMAARGKPLTSFVPAGNEATLALKLSGKFHTAFPAGKPEAKPEDPSAPSIPGLNFETGGGDEAQASTDAQPQVSQSNEEAKSEEKKPEEDKANASEVKKDHLMESVNEEGVVYLFADSDLLWDNLIALPDPRTGALFNSNLAMVLNLVETALGGSELLEVRSRAVTRRPFVEINRKKEEIESRYRPEIERLQREMQEKSNQILQVKEKDGQLLLYVDEEGKRKIEELQQDEISLREQEREIRKSQKKELDQMKTTFIALNMAAMPAFLTIIGLAFAIYRRWLTRAR